MFVVRERAREGRNGVAEMVLWYTEQRTGAQGLSKVCATPNDLYDPFSPSLMTQTICIALTTTLS